VSAGRSGSGERAAFSPGALSALAWPPALSPAPTRRRFHFFASTPTRERWEVPGKRGPVSDDDPTDGYALIPIELDWTKYAEKPGDNVAYYNPTTGVKITHFPVIHTRKGSIGYKLEWNGLIMVYTSDTNLHLDFNLLLSKQESSRS
jgi:hypothetical protein